MEYVRCDVCGDWFPAGNVFRNHQCVNYPSEDNMVTPQLQEGQKMVQCEICGEWFVEGNEFRNHQCVNYPSEDNPEL